MGGFEDTKRVWGYFVFLFCFVYFLALYTEFFINITGHEHELFLCKNKTNVGDKRECISSAL